MPEQNEPKETSTRADTTKERSSDGTLIGEVSVNLARRCKPDYRCFEQLHSALIAWLSLGLRLWQGYDSAGLDTLSLLEDISSTQLTGLVGEPGTLAILANQWWFLVHLARPERVPLGGHGDA